MHRERGTDNSSQRKCNLGKPKPATTAPGHGATVIVMDRSATDMQMFSGSTAAVPTRFDTAAVLQWCWGILQYQMKKSS